MKMDNKEVVEVVEEKKEVVAEVAEDITEETIKANEEAIKELTEEEKIEKLEEARVSAQTYIGDRIKDFTALVLQFDEMIESYDTLIAVVRENKPRFKQRFMDIVEQFTAANFSYNTQRRNIKKTIKKYKRIQNNPSKWSAKKIIDFIQKENEIR
jgi:hypothetical protein